MKINTTTSSLLISAALLAALLSSCFTGIESTPRISSGEVRKRDAEVLTPEQKFLCDINPQAPSSWIKGKRFFVTDEKISIIFQPQTSGVDSLNGRDIIFDRFETAPSITGTDATVIVFSTPGQAGELRYRINSSNTEILKRQRLEVPFTIERSLIEDVDSAMRGHSYYISTPKWYSSSDNKAINGKRHILVDIRRIAPGSYIYPLRVYFTCDSMPGEYWIPMTIGDDRAATRNFHTVFNFDNPRKRYPQITDKTWRLIVNSQVTTGMTRDECRLALGAPNSYRTIPVYNAIVEQWSYDDGLYLIFEDGILTRYRI